jgi:uncharacterized membrane protein YbhN (UPF0104 family)
MKNSFRQLPRVIGLVLGVGLFIFTIRKLGGFAQIAHALAQVGVVALAGIVINSLLWMLGYSRAWQAVFASLSQKVRFWPLFKIKLSGEGVNVMTPLGFLAGDSVRVLLLEKISVPEGRVHSVMVDRWMHSVAAQIVCILGLLFLVREPVDFPFWLSVSLLAFYVTLVVGFFLLWILLKRGLSFERLSQMLLKRMKASWRPKLDNFFQTLEVDFEYFSSHRWRDMVAPLLWHVLGRLLGVTEIAIGIFALTGRWELKFSLMISTLTSFFSVAFGFIPGALGILEKLYATFFAIYQLDPVVGVTVQLLRRLRGVFWMLVGVMVLDYKIISKSLKKAA